MKGRWMLVLALLAVPATATAQQRTIGGSDGIAPEDFRNYETGMINSFASLFENGVMVERGGFGQAFTVDRGSTLLSLVLSHRRCWSYTAEGIGAPTGPCLFREYVAGFDPASGRLTEVLWTSPVYPSPTPGSGPWPFRPNLWLDPGKYVAFALWEANPPEPGSPGRPSRTFPSSTRPPAIPPPRPAPSR